MRFVVIWDSRCSLYKIRNSCIGPSLMGFVAAKRHPNLPPRALDAYHPLYFHQTTSDLGQPLFVV
jgi:hypothetical protein